MNNIKYKTNLLILLFIITPSLANETYNGAHAYNVENQLLLPLTCSVHDITPNYDVDPAIKSTGFDCPNITPKSSAKYNKVQINWQQPGTDPSDVNAVSPYTMHGEFIYIARDGGMCKVTFSSRPYTDPKGGPDLSQWSDTATASGNLSCTINNNHDGLTISPLS